MVQCPTCKEFHQDGTRFCPHDGTPLTETAASREVLTPPGNTRKMDLQLPVIVGGRYRLEEVRGGGGMAKVYRGVDMTLGRDVAVKLINTHLRDDPEFDARFHREARVASLLSDPHIVVVHDFGIDPEHGPYLVMEYLQGQSLRERLRSDGPMPVKAALQLSGQLFLALIHAHDKGFIHRDIKPDNLFLLNQSGVRLHLRVLDFGIARIMGRDEFHGEAITSPGAVLGTPRYMSPEQLAGAQVDARTDLYSAALVIHESITGQVPHPTSKRLREICPEAPESLEKLLEDCLQLDPADRPPSALEVYLRLQEAGKASGVLMLPPHAMDKLLEARRKSDQDLALGSATTIGPEKPRRISRGALLIGILLVLILLVAGGFLVRHYFFPPTAVSGGPESVLGFKIDDPQQQVVDALKLTKGGRMNPWATGTSPLFLGHTLRPADLQLDEKALENLIVQWSADDRVAVIFHGEKVRALVVREPHEATTGRGLQIRASVADVYNLYNEVTPRVEHIKLSQDEDPTGKDWIEIRRFDQLGIAFEIHRARISAITLYPKATTP